MKKITEQSLVEMSRHLKSRLNEEENIMRTAAQTDRGTKFGTGIHNAVRTTADATGNFLNAMVGAEITDNNPLIDPDDQSLYVVNQGKKIPLTGSNNGHHFISGDPDNNDLPFYGPIIGTTGAPEDPDFFWKGEGTYQNHLQVPVGKMYKRENNLMGTPESNPNVAAAIQAATHNSGTNTTEEEGTTALDDKTGKPIIFHNGKWEFN